MDAALTSSIMPKESEQSSGQHGETLYVSKFYQLQNGQQVTKHIFVGKTRIASKMSHKTTGQRGFSNYELKQTYYYHPDYLGSSNYITDHEGEVYEHIEYMPYGETWIDEVSNKNIIDYKFTGKELDTETGLYYFGARYLDPQLSRWISTDPAIEDYMPEAPIDKEAKKRNQNLPGGGGVFSPVNLAVYHYSGNNPINYKDPDGHMKISLKDGGYLFTNISEQRFYPSGKIDNSTGFHISKKAAAKGKMIYGVAVDDSKVYTIEGLEKLDKKYSEGGHWKASGYFSLSAIVNLKYFGGVAKGVAEEGIKSGAIEAGKVLPNDLPSLSNTALGIRKTVNNSFDAGQATLGILKGFIPLKGTYDSFMELKAHAADNKIKYFRELEYRSEENCIILK